MEFEFEGRGKGVDHEIDRVTVSQGDREAKKLVEDDAQDRQRERP